MFHRAKVYYGITYHPSTVISGIQFLQISRPLECPQLVPISVPSIQNSSPRNSVIFYNFQKPLFAESRVFTIESILRYRIRVNTFPQNLLLRGSPQIPKSPYITMTKSIYHFSYRSHFIAIQIPHQFQKMSILHFPSILISSKVEHYSVRI